MSVSELATAMPEEGGSYHLISRSLGPLAAAIVGPANWLGLSFATGFYLIGFAEYLADFVPIPNWATELGAGLVLVFLNYRGSKLTGTAQSIFVSLLVLILAVFVGFGLFNIEPQLHEPFVPYGWGAVFSTVGLIIVSFVGFEKVSTVAGELKRPGRNLPWAILGSVAIATIIYAGVLYVMTGVLSPQQLLELDSPLVEAASQFMGRAGAIVIGAAALLATAGASNASILSSSRINFAMGRDRILPSWFSKIHPRYMTPHNSILVTGGLAILLALSGQASTLAKIASALLMISYALLTVGLVVMRQSSPDWYQPSFRVPFSPWLPLSGGIAALAVIATLDRFSQLAGLGLAALSLVWYFLWARKRTTVEGELSTWLQREHPLRLAIANANIEPAVATSHRSILVPVGSLGQGQDSGIGIQALLQGARRIASGIVGVVKHQTGTRLLLLGWHGPLRLRRIRKSIDKEVMRNAQCDVAVLRDKQLEEIRRVLVPVSDNPHARFGLRLTHYLQQNTAAQVVALHVTQPTDDRDIAAKEQSIRKLIRHEVAEANGGVAVRVIQSASVVEAIVDEAKQGYDLIVMGASEEWFLRKLLFSAISDEVAQRVPCSVLLVRKHELPTALSLERIAR